MQYVKGAKQTKKVERDFNNPKCKSLETEFIIAVRKQKHERIRALLPKIDLFAGREEGFTFPLLYCVYFASSKILEYIFLQYPQHINATDVNGRTLLLALVDRGEIKRISWMIRKGANIHLADRYGRSPLISAVLKKNVPLMQMFMQNKADPEWMDNLGRTANQLARDMGIFDLHEFSCEDDGENEDRIFQLVRSASVASVQEKLQPEQTKMTDRDGLTLAYYAIEQNSFELMESLLDKGMSLEQADSCGFTALFYSVIMGNGGMTSYLLDLGSNVNVIDHLGRSPLYYALQHPGIEGYGLVQLLLARNVSVNRIDRYGDSPLVFGSLYGLKTKDDLAKLQLLLEKGADVFYQGMSGRSVLHYAVMLTMQRKEYFMLDWVKMLLLFGADADSKDNAGEIPSEYVKNFFVKWDIKNILPQDLELQNELLSILKKRKKSFWPWKKIS